MRIGAKSLLFGAHQFIIHPFNVWLAWYWLYGKPPTFKETVCVIVHDWGYIACSDMDDQDGSRHPILGARIAGFLFGQKYRDLCLFHSRHYSKQAGASPSKLCWADKTSLLFESAPFYLWRARLTGELKEYRIVSELNYGVSTAESDKTWLDSIKIANLKTSIENTRRSE